MKCVLSQLQDAGYRVSLEDDEIVLDWVGDGVPDGTVVGPLIDVVKAYKAEFIHALGGAVYAIQQALDAVVDLGDLEDICDTILARIDQGFDIWRTERLRLRGIDTPELYSIVGQQARDYVQHILEQVDCIVICTDSRDKYGRYLTDRVASKWTVLLYSYSQ